MSTTWIPRPYRRAVVARDAAFRCVYCLVGQGNQSLDHVISEDDDGPTHPRNLVVSCEWCNSRKGVFPLDLFAEYLARRGLGGKNAQAIIDRVNYQLAIPTAADNIDPNDPSNEE